MPAAALEYGQLAYSLAAAGMRSAAIIVFWRAFPFLLWTILGPPVPRAAKLRVALVWTLSALLGSEVFLTQLPAIAGTLGGLIYLLALSYVVVQSLPQLAAAPAVCHALLCLIALVLPVWMLPSGSAALSFVIVVGWEFALSLYSYLREVGRRSELPTVSETLFFLLVSPELVYPPRAERAEPSWRLGTGRTFLGCTLMLLATSSTPLLQSLRPALDLGRSADGLFYGACMFMAIYAAQSALAHIQSGLCHELGRAVPERYQYPLKAKDPRDFWSRWNTYIGDWARVYLFGPMWRAVPFQRWKVPLATLGTFGVIGVMHDGCVSLTVGGAMLGITPLFLVWGGLVLAWPRPILTLPSHVGAIGPYASRIAVLMALSTCVWILK